MLHYWSLNGISFPDSWLTIGSFDGVHRGHQEIIHKMVAGAHASGAPAVVLTFYPHPLVVLGRRQGAYYLTTPEDRAWLLQELGIDVVITHPFNRDIAATSARDFIRHLHKHLNFSHLWVGYDFALGRGREGDVAALRQLGEQFNYHLHVIEPVRSQETPVSSSLVRAAIREGDVKTAASLLGRPYAVQGRVTHGDGRGRSLGIPTANLEVWSQQLLPKSGVYACEAFVQGRWYGAVTNIGVRPTFEQDVPQARVEAHLFDVDLSLYGAEMRLIFVARLRDEQKFPNIQALVDQIHQDVRQGKEILARSGVLSTAE